MDPVFGTKVSVMKDKEKILERQKRLAEQRDFLKDKFKKVTEKKSNVNSSTLIKKSGNNSNQSSLSTTSNQKKQSASVQSNNTEITSKPSEAVLKSQNKFLSSTNVAPSTSTNMRSHLKMFTINEDSVLSSSKFHSKVESSACDNTIIPATSTSKGNPKFRPAPANTPPFIMKHSKSSNNHSKKSRSSEPKQEKNSGTSDKKTLKKKSRHGMDGKFYSTSVMNDYLRHTGSKPFILPPSEYKELLKIKSSETNQSSASKLLDEEQVEKEKHKCFNQLTPSIEVREDDGPITDCYIDKKHLILVHRDAINVYRREDRRSKEWAYKDSMKKLRFNDILKEKIISCNINNKDSLVLCQIHLVTEEGNRKRIIKMAQYRFLEGKGKVMKEYLLGSFDCALQKLQCCHIAKRPCCFAVTGWNVARARTIGWVFTHSEVNDIMRCGAMIPVKHEVDSLHDISLTPYRNVLLAFGGRVFTIWNAKTGERLVNCSLDRLAPKNNITCHFGCFATIQKGFLFILVDTEDKIHMIATNLDTEVSKSLRKFKMPKDNKCIGVAVKDDKLVGITDKAIICWSLKTTLRIQHIRLEDGSKPFLFKSRILITSDNRLKKILNIRSDADYRQEMANKMKELMNYAAAENEAIKAKITSYNAIKKMNK